MTLVESKVEFDVLFGPAYKGIPLASATTIALSDLNRNVLFSFNRKEAKDHGEGGNLIGSDLKDKRVVIVDDVITAGTAIRQSFDIIKGNGGILCAVIILLDRQEKAPDSELSAIQQIQREYGIPVISIVNLDMIIKYLRGDGGYSSDLQQIEEYRRVYGIN